MKKVSIVFTALFLVIGMAEGFASSSYNQVFSTDNADGKINAKSIEKAFNASGMHVDVNNDMNSIFEKRYKKVHHKAYNLAIFTNNALVTKLMKKHPRIGLITPLSMSIFSDEKNQLERVEIIDRSLHNSIVKVNGTLNKLQSINFNHNINVVNKETARVKGMKEEQKKINQPHDVSFLKTKDSELSEEIKAAKHSIECANKHMEVMKQFTDSVREYIMLSNYEET